MQTLESAPHSKPAKSITRSFRISQSAFNALHEEATRKGVSVNTLLNQLLTTYANFDRYLARFGFIKLTVATFRRLMEEASETTAQEAGRFAGSHVAEALIDSMVGEVTVESILDFLKKAGDNTDLFNYSEVPRHGKRKITLSHNLGMKASIFYASYVEALLESVDIHPRIRVHADALGFEIS